MIEYIICCNHSQHGKKWFGVDGVSKLQDAKQGVLDCFAEIQRLNLDQDWIIIKSDNFDFKYYITFNKENQSFSREYDFKDIDFSYGLPETKELQNETN